MAAVRVGDSPRVHQRGRKRGFTLCGLAEQAPFLVFTDTAGPIDCPHCLLAARRPA